SWPARGQACGASIKSAGSDFDKRARRVFALVRCRLFETRAPFDAQILFEAQDHFDTGEGRARFGARPLVRERDRAHLVIDRSVDVREGNVEMKASAQAQRPEIPFRFESVLSFVPAE